MMLNRFIFGVLMLIAGTVQALEIKCSFSKNEIEAPGIKWHSEAPIVQYNYETLGMRSALLLTRGNPKKSLVSVIFDKPIPPSEDFTIAFDLARLDDNSSVVIVTAVSNIYIKSTGVVALLNRDRSYENTKIRLAPNVKYRLIGKCSRESGMFTLTVKDFPEACVNINPVFPMSKVVLLPSTPSGTRTLLDNFEFKSFPAKIVSRENVTIGVMVELSDGTKTYKLTDSDLWTPIAIPADSIVTFYLPERVEATGVQIFGGDPAAAKFPSGDCSPTGYVIEGMSNGAWVELAKCNNVSKFDAEKLSKIDISEQCENFFQRHEFKNIMIDLFRIRFTGTHDTGLRFGSTQALPSSKRLISLREIQLFSSKKAVQKVDISDLVQMDYRLPVYRKQKNAELTIIVSEHEKAPDRGALTLQNPDGTIVFSKTIGLSKGIQTQNIPLDMFGNGRYLTTLEIGKYKIKRLLRIDRIPDRPCVPVEPLHVTGKKLYFTPDHYIIKSEKYLTVKSFPGKKMHLLAQSAPGKLWITLRDFYPSNDGTFVLTLDDHEYKGYASGNTTRRNLISKKVTGPYCKSEYIPTGRKSLYPLRQGFRPEIQITARPPAGIKYQLYDSARDGKVPLNSIHTIFSYKPEDYGCLIAPARTHWAVGKTTDGRWVMMSNKPILTDQWLYMDNELDDGQQSNDNAGGQWWAWDKNGEELLWAIGQTVKRNAPYAVKYDNLGTAFRILALYGTRDGIHWKFHNYLTLPDEQDSTGAQHYGGMPIPLANGDLMLYQLYAYDAESQQIYLELIYSRDGIHFYRFPGQRWFVRSSNPNDWYFGHVFPTGNFFKDGDKLYQQLITSSCPHFFPEVLMLHENQKDITADSFRKRYEKRGLAERLPYFKSIGGWKGLAEYGRRGYYSISLLETRFDGWFGLVAGIEEGTFETRRFSANGKITANAEIAPDGFIELTVLDRSGHELMKTRLSGNSCDLPVFERLPDGEFCIRGRMKNAILYTLSFSANEK